MVLDFRSVVLGSNPGPFISAMCLFNCEGMNTNIKGVGNRETQGICTHLQSVTTSDVIIEDDLQDMQYNIYSSSLSMQPCSLHYGT